MFSWKSRVLSVESLFRKMEDAVTWYVGNANTNFVGGVLEATRTTDMKETQNALLD